MATKATKKANGLGPDKTDKLLEAMAGATTAIAQAVAGKEDLAELDIGDLIERWNAKPTSEKLAVEISRRTGGVYLAKPGSDAAVAATTHLAAHYKAARRPYAEPTWGNFVVLQVSTRGAGEKLGNPFTRIKLVSLEEGIDLPEWMDEDLAGEYVNAETPCYDPSWDVVFPTRDQGAMRQLCWIAACLESVDPADQIRTGNQCADLVEAIMTGARLPRAAKKALLLLAAEPPNSPKVTAAMGRLTILQEGPVHLPPPPSTAPLGDEVMAFKSGGASSNDPFVGSHEADPGLAVPTLSIVAVPEDAAAVAALWMHLAVARRNGLIAWNPNMIPAGSNAAEAWNTAMAAPVIAMLITPSLVANDAMMTRLQAAQARGSYLVPINWSPVAMDGWLANLQAVPENPIASSRDRDIPLVEVANRLCSIVAAKPRTNTLDTLGRLKTLMPSQFEEVIFRLDLDPAILLPASNQIGVRAVELLRVCRGRESDVNAAIDRVMRRN